MHNGSWLRVKARSSASNKAGLKSFSLTGLNRFHCFVVDFIKLNIINFVDIEKREKNTDSWDVQRVSSP